MVSGNKQSLFSRMSPNARIVNSHAEKSAKPSGTSATLTMEKGSQSQLGNGGHSSSVSKQAPGGNSAAQARRIGQSPFREALTKGVLSGAGLLTC